MRIRAAGDEVNVVGGAYALTVITPILRGHEQEVRSEFARLPKGTESPFARVPGTHFARWVVLPRLPYWGPPQRRDELRSPHLLFSSTFDGARDPYLDLLCEQIPREADAVWGHCAGYPDRGAQDADAFKRYMRHNQIPTGLFFAAYPHATLDQVRLSLRRRAQLREFVIAARRKSPSALQADFRREFGPPDPNPVMPCPDVAPAGA